MRDEPRGLPHRSYLFVPGSSEHRLAKALELEADAILVDLEDSVAPDLKALARETVTRWLDAGAAVSGRPIFVRVNLDADGVPAEDLRVACRRGVEGIFLPKVDDAAVLGAVDAAVSELEDERHLQAIAIVALLETARGILDLRALVAGSARLRAVAIGVVDLMADLGASDPSSLMGWARAQVVLSSRAAGLGPPIDTVFLDVTDHEGLVRATRAAKGDGCFGKLLIHPSQIDPVNAIFSPSTEEVAAATRLLEAYDASVAAGEGAMVLDGRLVDRASVRAARSLVALASRSARRD